MDLGFGGASPRQSPKNGPEKSKGFREEIVELARTRGSAVEVFGDFCRMAACSLAAQTREAEYLAVAKRYQRDELDKLGRALGQLITEMEAQPFTDLLGPCYITVASPATIESRGEFYTPREISQAIARLLMDVDAIVEKGSPVTVLEPAAGSGGMVLALTELFAPAKAVDLLRVTCWDVSPVACDMAYINLTLWGVPAEIVCGNSLSRERRSVHTNIHWHRVGEPQRLMVEAMREFLKASFADKQPAPGEERAEKSNVVFPQPEKRFDSKGQLLMDFDGL
jgi:hypothetical protein